MSDDRLRRIQLLSRRFNQLQGLRPALAGASLAVAVGTYLAVTPEPTNAGALIAASVSIVPPILGFRPLNHYYAATFGRQLRHRPKTWWPLFAFGFFYSVVTSWLNKSYPAIPAGAPTVALGLLVGGAIAIRDWPWRAYYLILPATVGVAFAVCASGGSSFAPGVTLALIFLAVGVSMLAIGLLDHWTLVRLSKESREMQLTDER